MFRKIVKYIELIRAKKRYFFANSINNRVVGLFLAF